MLKLKFVDFWKGFNPEDNMFINIIKTKYDIELVDKNPEFIICSIFGNNFKKYDCTRIFYCGENITPNFNAYDYAMGFDYLDFSDRYLRLPIYYLYNYQYKDKINDTRDEQTLLSRDFCSFVYSNKNWCDSKRKELFYLLNSYKKVSSGGAVLNNIGHRVQDKIDFQKNFKFSIACENSSYPGYTTEKIYEAFICRTIPIYWGNPQIECEFNKKAFINVQDFKNSNELLEYVIEIDKNDTLYMNMLNEPYLINGSFYQNLDDNKILSFFDKIFQKNPQVSYRKDALINRDENGRLKISFCKKLFKV